MLARIFAPLRDERGSSVIEYALIVSLIAMVCLVGMNLLGTNTKSQLASASTSIVNASASNSANAGNDNNGGNNRGGDGGNNSGGNGKNDSGGNGKNGSGDGNHGTGH